jgi:hypothetical protein
MNPAYGKRSSCTRPGGRATNDRHQGLRDERLNLEGFYVYVDAAIASL